MLKALGEEHGIAELTESMRPKRGGHASLTRTGASGLVCEVRRSTEIAGANGKARQRAVFGNLGVSRVTSIWTNGCEIRFELANQEPDNARTVARKRIASSLPNSEKPF